jgi:hypothetical protein
MKIGEGRTRMQRLGKGPLWRRGVFWIRVVMILIRLWMLVMLGDEVLKEFMMLLCGLSHGHSGG